MMDPSPLRPTFPLAHYAQSGYCSFPGCDVSFRGAACSEHREWAAAYYASEYWKAKQAAVLERSHGVCEYCLRRYAQTCHHRNYRGFGGHEHLGDLMAMCHPCHDQIHYHVVDYWRVPPHRSSPAALGDEGYTADTQSPGHWMHADLYQFGESRNERRFANLYERLIAFLGGEVAITDWSEILAQAIDSNSEKRPTKNRATNRPIRKGRSGKSANCGTCGASLDNELWFDVERCKSCAMAAETKALESSPDRGLPTYCIDCREAIRPGTIRCPECKSHLTLYLFRYADMTGRPDSNENACGNLDFRLRPQERCHEVVDERFKRTTVAPTMNLNSRSYTVDERLFFLSGIQLTANAKSAGSVQIKADMTRVESEVFPRADFSEFKYPVSLLFIT